MSTIHSSKYRPTIKELGDGANHRWSVLLELSDGTGLEAFDTGRTQVSFLLPSGATEDDARTLRDALDAPGVKLGIIQD